MPHKEAICHYCHKPMTIGRVHPTMTPYHGACRMEQIKIEATSADAFRILALRQEWDALVKATKESLRLQEMAGSERA